MRRARPRPRAARPAAAPRAVADEADQLERQRLRERLAVGEAQGEVDPVVRAKRHEDRLRVGLLHAGVVGLQMHPAAAAERVDGVVVERHLAKQRVEAAGVAGRHEAGGEQVEIEGAPDRDPFEVGYREGRALAQQVAAQRNRPRFHGAESEQLDARALVRAVDEAEVDGLLLEGVQDGGVGHLERRDGAAGRAVGELVDERHRLVPVVEEQVVERERLERDGERFRGHVARLALLDEPVDLVELAQHCVGVREELQAFVGGVHALAAVEQLEARLVLERADRLGNGLLGDEQLLCGPCYASAMRHCRHVSQLMQLHGTSPVLACVLARARFAAGAGATRDPACPSPCLRWN